MSDYRAQLAKDKVFANGLANALLIADEYYREHPEYSPAAKPVEIKEPRATLKKKTVKKKAAQR